MKELLVVYGDYAPLLTPEQVKYLSDELVQFAWHLTRNNIPLEVGSILITGAMRHLREEVIAEKKARGLLGKR